MKRENITKQTILVAFMPDYADWNILHEQLWYRIPVNTAPAILRTGDVEYIAFYHSAKFKEDLKWKVVKYGKIKQMSIVARTELFPEEPFMPQKSTSNYYKIEFETLLSLKHPFVSRRGHRISFIPTTAEQFWSGQTNLNTLFKGSPLEQKMVKIMDDLEIEYEREWVVVVEPKKKYRLDFVIFCKKRNIDVECDGNEFHTNIEQVQYDKTRNNELESHGWSVLRYTTKDLTENLSDIQKTLCKSIEQCGGMLKAAEPEIAYHTKINGQGQFNLF
ncbi:MAG: hypothetical protein RLZZ628_681 [Bacteroidota bacterium]|jgi:very-short-patch-repair endonuclease